MDSGRSLTNVRRRKVNSGSSSRTKWPHSSPLEASWVASLKRDCCLEA
jgi:hypothetical protein